MVALFLVYTVLTTEHAETASPVTVATGFWIIWQFMYGMLGFVDYCSRQSDTGTEFFPSGRRVC